MTVRLDQGDGRGRARGARARAARARRKGGYAVEVEPPAARALVGVELGAFADGVVEVTGDLRDGDKVVVPS